MCRQSVLLHAALLVMFLGILPKAIQSMPLSSDVHGGLITIPGGNEETSQCVNFTNHYCSQFENRNTAYFPNLRGHKTVAEADKEFQDFIPLLQSGCHPKLGTLLCFIYFPFCEPSYPSLRIYPCYEVCQEVHDSSCTALINQYAGWNQPLQCNGSDNRPQSHYLPKSSGQCSYGVAPHYPGSPTFAPTEAPSTEAPTKSDVDECADGTHDCDENADCINTDGNFTCTCKSGYTGDGRTCTVVCNNESCPSDCDYRKNANSGTFKRNPYCYAARVTVKSYKKQGCNHTYQYNVEVKSQLDIETPFNSSHSTKAPSMGESAVIVVSPSRCPNCPKMDVGITYLIAGAYSKAADGRVQWKLEGVGDKSLISEWITRYDRKIDQFVSGGNSDRRVGPKYLKECEGNIELVSQDQWIHH